MKNVKNKIYNSYGCATYVLRERVTHVLLVSMGYCYYTSALVTREEEREHPVVTWDEFLRWAEAMRLVMTVRLRVVAGNPVVADSERMYR